MDDVLIVLYLDIPVAYFTKDVNHSLIKQLGRSPKVVALFSAANFSSYIIELLQVHDTIQIKWKYAWIHYSIAIRSHLMCIKFHFCHQI